MIPAIIIIVLASLGLIAGIYGTISAIISQPPPVDPEAPEFMKQFAQGSVGPVAAAMQAWPPAFFRFLTSEIAVACSHSRLAFGHS
jgi:hypothetical protein